MTVAFEVLGVPIPQGSKRGFVVGNRAVVVDDNKVTLREWRSAVAHAAMNEANNVGLHFGRPTPVRVSIEFRLPRPKTQTKAERDVAWVTTRPDIDKLTRGVLDALTIGNVFQDDSQVAQLAIDKRYAELDETTGAYVIVRPLA